MKRASLALMTTAIAGLLGSQTSSSYMRAPMAGRLQPRIYTKSRSNGRKGAIKTGRKYTHLKTGRTFKGHYVMGQRQVINHRP